MKTNKLFNSLKTRHTYVCMVALLPFLVMTCHHREKQNQIKKLDTQISTLDKEISGTSNFRTAKMPANLTNTQARYNTATDSLNNQADTLQICMLNNESLVTRAFNNYATRIGRDFQASAFLPKSDIIAFQQHIANLDSMDFIHEQARSRILQNKGSLHDLSYFFEMLDFDSINCVLNNKLAWNFYSGNVFDDGVAMEESVLNFENDTLNAVLQNEINLLNRAWEQNNVKQPNNDSTQIVQPSNKPDSVTRTQNDKDTTTTFNVLQPGAPNFSIPEFDSVRIQYMRNDSIINAYNNMFMNMIRAEDSLEQYRQQMIHTRDSLVERRNELEK